MRLRTRLTLFLLAAAAVPLAAAGVFTSITVADHLRGRAVSELRTLAGHIDFHLRRGMSGGPGGYEVLRSYARAGAARLELVSPDGEVLFDSHLPEADLGRADRGAVRPEVAEAVRGRIGTAVRRDPAAGVDRMYVARPVLPPLPERSRFSGAAVICLSAPLTEVQSAIADIRATVLLASALLFAALLAAVGVMAGKLSRPIRDMARVAERIRAGELDRRIAVRSAGEIGELGGALNAMIETLNLDIVRLRKLERVRTEFLANVSHELRTPIFAIQGMLETLLDGAVDDAEVNRDFLRRALANTTNLNTLLNDLIEISRIESGDMKLSFRTFDAGELVRGVAAEMGPIAARRDIVVEAPGGGEQCEVYGDRERLRQVLVNLVDNAVKYNRPGGTIRLGLTREDGAVRLSVEDNGIGIEPEDQERIFERFYRVDKERSREAGGTGLGLAIVKHIVEAHGSRVSVESRAGAGSVFSFTLRRPA